MSVHRDGLGWDRLRAAGRHGACLAVIGLAALSASAAGCSIVAQGNYKGASLKPPVQKVVLFDIEGKYGPEFTQLLAAELVGACKNKVVVVKQGEVPLLSDAFKATNPASVVRDLGAQAYIKGAITRSEQVHTAEYYVMGNFDLFDPQKEGIIGGLSDVRAVGRRDYGAGKTKAKGATLDPANAQKVHVALARRVAAQLAKGMGY